MQRGETARVALQRGAEARQTKRVQRGSRVCSASETNPVDRRSTSASEKNTPQCAQLLCFIKVLVIRSEHKAHFCRHAGSALNAKLCGNLASAFTVLPQITANGTSFPAVITKAGVFACVCLPVGKRQ